MKIETTIQYFWKEKGEKYFVVPKQCPLKRMGCCNIGSNFRVIENKNLCSYFKFKPEKWTLPQNLECELEQSIAFIFED